MKGIVKVAVTGFLLIILVLLTTSLVQPVAQVSAQEVQNANLTTLVSLLNIPLCTDAFALTPENPAFIHPNEYIRYSWSNEPEGTAHRDFVAYDYFSQPDGTFLSSGNLTIETATPLEYTTAILAGNVLPGTYNWMAVFYDGADNAICRTTTYWLDVRGSGASGNVTTPSSEGSNTVIIATACGYFVVALNESPFTGPADLTLAPNVDNYDGSGLALNGNCGLEIHGNNRANVLTGGNGNDRIFGYRGNDTLSGGSGDDFIDGGVDTFGGAANASGNTTATTTASAFVTGDTIDGGPGNDTLIGGDEIGNTSATSNGAAATAGVLITGRAGDIINGGEGNDSIDGGNSNITFTAISTDGVAEVRISGQVGDVIDGGPGDDTINGGNETATLTATTAGGTADAVIDADFGDTIDGGTGSDVINGGNETVTSIETGAGANAGVTGNVGDTLNANDAANNDDGAVDNLDGNGGTNACQSSPGDSETNC